MRDLGLPALPLNGPTILDQVFRLTQFTGTAKMSRFDARKAAQFPSSELFCVGFWSCCGTCAYNTTVFLENPSDRREIIPKLSQFNKGE